MSGELILVIDDSKEIARHLTQQLLPTLGYKTLQAFDGRSGLDIVRQQNPDLIMLDLNLPEMTGLDVLQSMAKESIHTPVVLMTGYGSEKNAIDAFRLGIKDYLVKPFTVDEVVTAINRALSQSAAPAPEQPAAAAAQPRDTTVESMRRQLSQMKTLFGIGKAITSLLSIDQILERLLEAAVYLTNAEESIIWLPESRTGLLRAFARRGEGGDKQLLSLKMQDSQVGQVMRNGRPLRQYTGTGQGFKVKTGYLARAIMYVPLMVRGRALGVLSVTNRLSPRAFSERDEFLLVALADYGAIALHNARRFQASDQALAAGAEDLRTLVQITRAMTASLDLDEVVRLAMQQIHDSWQVEACSIWLVDEASASLRVLDSIGAPHDILKQIEVPLGKGIVGYAVHTGKSMTVNDVADNPLHYRQVDEATGFTTRNLLCVPLVSRQATIGALELVNKQNGGFNERDVERAESLAGAMAIAVGNALYYRRSEARQEQLIAALEHHVNPVLLTDEEGRISLLNRQAREHLDLGLDAIGRPAREALQPPALADFLGQPAGDGSPQTREIGFPDDSFWRCIRARVPSHGHILVLQDLSDLKRLEETRAHFVTTVARDMETGLTRLRRISRRSTEAGEADELEAILAELTSLVADLRTLATRDVGEQGAHEMVPLVEAVVSDLQPKASDKDVQVRLTAGPGSIPVLGDPAALRRAIGSLVDTAIKQSPHGAAVEITVLAQAGMARVRVHDRGPVQSGAAAGEAATPLADEGSTVNGHSQRLALARSIAVAHRGDVWAEDDETAGSTVTFQLPLAPD